MASLSLDRAAMRALFAACALWMAGCDTPIPSEPGPAMRMDFAGASVFDAPFPSAHWLGSDGAVRLTGLPVSRGSVILRQIQAALGQQRGFGTTSAVQLSFEAALDPTSVPTGTRMAATDLVQLVNVERGSARFGERAPVDVYYADDGGRYGGQHVLSLVPVQGIPLEFGARYAVLVLDGLRTREGDPIARAPALSALVAHAQRGASAPPGLEGEALRAYVDAFRALPDVGIVPEALVGMGVFSTQDPTAQMALAVRTTEARLALDGVSAAETFPDYCVFRAQMELPVFQAGVPPYATSGGAWRWDGGRLVEDHRESAVVWITLPRTPMPPRGFPLAMLIRTGAGADRALIDRGRNPAPGVDAPAGTGPAVEFAQAGWAGFQVEGPHGGSRNVSGGDEQFLVFNIQNTTALRDNLRQSALELVLVARALEAMRIDASSCAGLEQDDVRFDVDQVALIGHSMGASIAPLAAAFEPRFGTLILSGAGGSWMNNILYKESPIATRPFAATLLGYPADRVLREDDSPLSLLQWAGEEADAVVYAPALVSAAAAPRDVLVFQGIRDTYIPPPVANPLALALGLDVVEPVLDASVRAQLALVGRGAAPLPLSGNVRGVTAGLVQLQEDGIQDGHEVMWQRPDARAVLRCFLHSAREGAPVIADAAALPPGCGGS